MLDTPESVCFTGLSVGPMVAIIFIIISMDQNGSWPALTPARPRVLPLCLTPHPSAGLMVAPHAARRRVACPTRGRAGQEEGTCMRLVVGISGSTGAIYGVRLLEVLHGHPDLETHVVVSEAARKTIEFETDRSYADVCALATVI